MDPSGLMNGELLFNVDCKLCNKAGSLLPISRAFKMGDGMFLEITIVSRRFLSGFGVDSFFKSAKQFSCFSNVTHTVYSTEKLLIK